MTALDFFAHFPTLHPFLLDQLTQATRGMGETPADQQEQMLEMQHAALLSKEADAPDWGAAMHPSLYPVLLLLSRLIPSPTDESAAGASSTRLDTHAFLPLIRACSSHPYWQARFMAAKAAVSLVAVGQLKAYLHEIVDALIAAGNQSQPTHHNQLHGLLLQMETLMRFHHNESTLLSAQDKHALASALLPKLLASSGSARWLGVESRMSCAPIRLLFLQVVELCVEFVEAPAVSAPISAPIDALAAKARQQLLVLTAQACEVRVAAAVEFIGIGVDGLRASAVSMLVRCLCCLDPATVAATPADLTGLILSLLRDSVDGPVPSLMLLEQLLWSLHRAFTLHGTRLSALLDLPAIARWILREHLVRFSSCFATSPKTNHSILELGLQIVLAVWSQQQERGELNLDAPGDAQQAVRIEEHWDAFLTYATQSVDVAAKGAAFQCLAACLDLEMCALRKQMRADGEAAVAPALRGFLQHACTFIELLEAFMDDEQPVLLRYACVQAIQHSGLLKPAVTRLALALPQSEAAVVHTHILPAPDRSSPSTSPLLSMAIAFRSVPALLVRLWCSPLLHLLCDENDSVRVDASNLAGGLVELTDEAWAQLAGTAADEVSPSIHSGETLVARVLEQSFFFVESRFHAEPSLAQSLQQIMRFFTVHFESTWDNAASSKGSGAAALEQPAGSAASAASPSPSPSAPLKLFEHEKPNTVIEEPVLIEIAARVYAKLLQRQAATLAQDDRVRFTAAVDADLAWWISGLQSALDSVVQSDAPAWVGGASFMEQPFVRIFGFALGVRSMAGVGVQSVSLSNLQTTIARVIDSLHPMLQRTLRSVLQTGGQTALSSSSLVPPAARLVGIELNPGPSDRNTAQQPSETSAPVPSSAPALIGSPKRLRILVRQLQLQKAWRQHSILLGDMATQQRFYLDHAPELRQARACEELAALLKPAPALVQLYMLYAQSRGAEANDVIPIVSLTPPQPKTEADLPAHPTRAEFERYQSKARDSFKDLDVIPASFASELTVARNTVAELESMVSVCALREVITRLVLQFAVHVDPFSCNSVRWDPATGRDRWFIGPNDLISVTKTVETIILEMVLAGLIEHWPSDCRERNPLFRNSHHSLEFEREDLQCLLRLYVATTKLMYESPARLERFNRLWSNKWSHEVRTNKHEQPTNETDE